MSTLTPTLTPTFSPFGELVEGACRGPGRARGGAPEAAAAVPPALAQWRRHVAALGHVPADQLWRGCIGLGVLFAGGVDRGAGRRLLLPADSLLFVSLVDVDRNLWKAHRPREVHYATLRGAGLRWGMPALARRPLTACDFRREPAGRFVRGDGAVLPAGGDVLDPEHWPALFALLNAVNVSMSTRACLYRSAWRPYREQVLRGLGKKPGAGLVVGRRGLEGTPPATAWMPRAYVGVPEHVAGRVYDYVRYHGSDGAYLPRALRDRFLEAAGGPQDVVADAALEVVSQGPDSLYGLKTTKLHVLRDGRPADLHVLASGPACTTRLAGRASYRAGAAVAVESLRLSRAWEGWDGRQRWAHVESLLGAAAASAYLRLWLERQAARVVPGLVHYPADLIATVARDVVEATHPDALLWDVTPLAPWALDDGGESYVLPPLRQLAADDCRGDLGEVDADFTVHDPRLRTFPARRRA